METAGKFMEIYKLYKNFVFASNFVLKFGAY